MEPRSLQTAINISIFAFLGSLFVALRLWTRFIIIRAPGWEDYVLISSWICAIVTVISIGLQVGYGMGSHSNTLSQYQNQQIGLNLYISIITYCASLGLTKLAILMQYQRVFPTRKFQIWTWSFIVIITAYTISTVTAGIFVCWPVRRFWKPDVQGTCVNTLANWFANAIMNIITDLMIILLPMPVIRNLKLAPRQKWLLMGVFAFGVVVCVISLVRLHSLFVIVRSTDPSYDNAPAATFSIVEVNVALICACLPCLRPLLSQWFSGLSISTHSATHSYGANGSRHGQVRNSMLPSFVDRSFTSRAVHLSSLSTKRGSEGNDGDSIPDIEDDQIKVVTRVDVRVSNVHAVDGASTKDGRESSTESLFRNTKHIV